MSDYVPFNEYLAAPGYGSGALRQALRSLSHLHHYRITSGEPPSPSQMLGSATHCAVLEPRAFHDRYAQWSGDRRTKAGKEAYSEFIACNANKEILTAEQYETAWAMADTLLAMPEYRALISNHGQPAVEVSRFWEDTPTSVPLKARADMLLDDAGVDLKTASDASPRGFAAAAARYGYHIQAAMYCEAFKRDKFAFVAIENRPPFCAGIYWLDEASLELGRQLYREAVVKASWYHFGQDSWRAGYGEHDMQLPNWAFAEQEDDLEVTL